MCQRCCNYVTTSEVDIPNCSDKRERVCVEAPEYKKNGREEGTRIRGSGGGSAVFK